MTLKYIDSGILKTVSINTWSPILFSTIYSFSIPMVNPEFNKGHNYTGACEQEGRGGGGGGVKKYPNIFGGQRGGRESNNPKLLWTSFIEAP